MNYLGLNETGTKATAKELNTLLASYHVYYQNLRNFHWNVKGKKFFELHEIFETLYTDAMQKIDDIAERILTLKQSPVSNFSDYLNMSDIQEADGTITDIEMVNTMLGNHGILIRQMREVLVSSEQYNDEGTTDMIGSFIGDLEKTSWMLSAWLQGVEKDAHSLA